MVVAEEISVHIEFLEERKEALGEHVNRTVVVVAVVRAVLPDAKKAVVAGYEQPIDPLCPIYSLQQILNLRRAKRGAFLMKDEPNELSGIILVF